MSCLGFKFEKFLNKVWRIQEHEMRRWNMKFDIFSVPLNHFWEEVGKKSLRNSINIYEFKTNLCALAFSVPPQKKGKKNLGSRICLIQFMKKDQFGKQ